VEETRKQLVAKDVITSPDKDAVVHDAVDVSSIIDSSSSPSLLSAQVRETKVIRHEKHGNEFGPPCPPIFPVSAEEQPTETANPSLLKTITITVFNGVCAVIIVVGSLAYINWEWMRAQENLLLSLFWSKPPSSTSIEETIRRAHKESYFPTCHSSFEASGPHERSAFLVRSTYTRPSSKIKLRSPIIARPYYKPTFSAVNINNFSEPSTDRNSRLEKLSYLCSAIDGFEAPRQPRQFDEFQKTP
jgi:hypothetical protein